MKRSEEDIIVAVASDDGHPLQRMALVCMAFGFDEPGHQPVKIRALAHPDPDVRDAAFGKAEAPESAVSSKRTTQQST